MGAFGTNDEEVRGSSCDFPAVGHKKGKEVKGWVLAAGDSKNIPSESRYTDALDICGQETGKSGRVGGPKVYF